MATGATIRVAGVDRDFDDLFEPLGATIPGPSMGVPFLGADLSQRYAKGHGYDEWSADLGPKFAGVDIRHYFRKKGWTPPAPSITSFTYNGPKYEDETITLTVAYSALEVTSIVFKRPNGTTLPSAGAQCHFTPTSPSWSGTYSVQVTNAGGTATAYLSVTVWDEVDPPTIISQSGAGTYFVGDYITLSLVASGAEHYQWYGPTGGLLVGATSTSYGFWAISIEQSGTWTCVMTNDGGTTTAYFSVTINTPSAPSVTVSSNSPRSVGQTVNLTAVATGSGTKSYQWYDYLGFAISGATSSTYSFVATTIDQSGPWSCTVTTPYGSDSDSTYVMIL